MDEIWNSVVSQIWGGLALADFGHDPSSSDSSGIVFFQKTQKYLTKFQGLATSGRRNSAMSPGGKRSLRAYITVSPDTLQPV